jgi:hypothetical protein
MKEENIIDYEPTARRFHITRRDNVKLGYFYIVRVLYSIDATGKEWQEVMFAAIVGLLTIPAVVVDLFVLVVAGCAKLAYFVAKQIISLLVTLITIIFDKGVGTLLKWLIPTIIILTIYLKWDDITKLFDQLNF